MALKKNFNHQQIDKFIHNAEILLEPVSYVVTEQSEIKDYHIQLDDLLKQVEELKKETQRFGRGMLPGMTVCRNETVKEVGCLAPLRWSRLLDTEQNEPKSYHNEETQAMKNAREASNSLEKLSKALQVVREKSTHQIGRKPSDHYGICLNFGYLYFKAFNKMPSTTRGGPFIAVLQNFLEILSLPHKDPMRMIKQSLPELRKGLEIERNHDAQLRNR